MKTAAELHAAWLAMGHDASYAVGIETLETMRELFTAPDVKTVIEMGSGLTTLGLLAWRRPHQHVVTFEDDPAWFAKWASKGIGPIWEDGDYFAEGKPKHAFVSSYVDDANVRGVLNPDPGCIVQPIVDLAIHDGPSSPMMRPYYLQWLIGRFAPRTILVDDWHMATLAKACEAIFAREGYALDTRILKGVDVYGRYATVWRR